MKTSLIVISSLQTPLFVRLTTGQSITNMCVKCPIFYQDVGEKKRRSLTYGENCPTLGEKNSQLSQHFFLLQLPEEHTEPNSCHSPHTKQNPDTLLYKWCLEVSVEISLKSLCITWSGKINRANMKGCNHLENIWQRETSHHDKNASNLCGL